MTTANGPVPQGDLSLLSTDFAKALLASNTPARLAYTWTDGTPRVVPIWFHWTGDELVFGTFAESPKVKALTRNPAVAVTIDRDDDVTHALLLRGDATLEREQGVVAEYAHAARRYLGEEQGRAWVSSLQENGRRMVRVGLRPSWVGLIDFEGRFPVALGGVIE